MRLLRGFSVLTAACIAALAGAREPEVKLPDIGSSAAGIMSPQDLHDYGAAMLQEIRAYNLVLDDALLNDYINALGWRLVANSDHPDMSFTFFIVRDEQINAFAAPGGFVAANAGLLTAMQSEDELAGVLAHEISHVQQQHILRAFEDQKKMSVPIMLAMLGVMLATAHRSDDAGVAAMMTGTSLIQQRQINFTRGEEAEADRVGIQTLARSGFDPLAMAGAFQTLQKMMRVNGVDVPEFLLDHPLDTKRIAEAKARAEQLGCPKVTHLPPASAPIRTGNLDLALPARSSAATETSPPDQASAVAASNAATMTVDAGSGAGKTLPRVSVTTCYVRGKAVLSDFELMRERARVLSAGSATAMRAYYADNLRDNKAFDTIANRYGYALALIDTHEPQRAVAELRKLTTQQPTSQVLRLGLANAEDQAGNHADALTIYERLSNEFPGNRAITLTYADALLAKADDKSARRSLELLRPLVERYSDDPDLQKSYGRANQLAGDKVRAAEAYAEAAYLTGHAEDALNQLKALSRQSDLTYYQRSRIDARITQLTPTVLELRKRGAPSTPDSLTPTFTCCQPH
ncbi:M48 family metalloprotease [Dokdonella soli]|uniref:Putative beta-barrel assembly-enhancing protease n=1 Tax=Dokdonella soli TaxID=529810 RepID=A0ABN1IC25_9GAMM